MNTERILAYGCAESIRYMSNGRVPRRSRLRRNLAAWCLAVGVASLAVVAGAARAGTVLVAENQVGGQIRVTDVSCGQASGRVVMTTSANGIVGNFGCAYADGDALVVSWDKGGMSVFPWGVWRIVGQPTPTPEPAPESRWP